MRSLAHSMVIDLFSGVFLISFRPCQPRFKEVIGKSRKTQRGVRHISVGFCSEFSCFWESDTSGLNSTKREGPGLGCHSTKRQRGEEVRDGNFRAEAFSRGKDSRLTTHGSASTAGLATLRHERITPQPSLAIKNGVMSKPCDQTHV